MSPEFLGDCAGLHGAHSGRYGGPPWRSVFVSSLRSLTKTGAPDRVSGKERKVQWTFRPANARSVSEGPEIRQAR